MTRQRGPYADDEIPPIQKFNIATTFWALVLVFLRWIDIRRSGRKDVENGTDSLGISPSIGLAFLAAF